MDPVRNSQTATTGPSLEPPKAHTDEEERTGKIGQELILGREPPVARKELTNVKIQEKNQTTVHLERFAAIGSDKEKFESWKQENASLLEGRGDITAVSQLIKTLIKTSIEDGTSSLSEKEKRLLYRKVAETLNACTQTNSYEAQCDSFWVEEQLFTEPNPLTESEGTQIYTGLFDKAIPLALIDLNYTESECRRLYEVIEKIPQEDLEDAVQYMKDFFHEELSVSEKISFLQIIQKMPCQDREDFAKACLSLFTNHTSLLEKWDLLLVVFDFPPLQRRKAVEAFSHMFTPEMSADEKILHLWIAPTVSQHERAELVQVALSLFTASMSIQEKRELLEALTYLPPSERRQAAAASPELVISMNEWIVHLWVPPGTAKNEREDLVQAAISLFTPTMSVQEKREWLSAVLQFSPLKRKELVDAARSRLSPGMSMDENMLRLWIPSSTPQRERDELIAITRPLFTPTMSIEEKSEWLAAVMPLSPEQRRAMVDAARPRFTPEMSMNEKILQLWTVYIPPNEREDLIKAALTLFSDDSIKKFVKYCLFLAIVRRLPPLQRKEFVDNASRFFTAGICFEEKLLHLLIEPYALPEEDRKMCVQATFPLLLGATPLIQDAANLLNVICSISPAERMDVINHAKSLFTNEMTLQDKVTLLHIISGLSFFERSDIVTHAKALFIDAMSLEDKVALLHAIYGLRASERADIINHAKTLFPDTMGVRDKINLLELVCAIPYYDRKDAINYVKALFTDALVSQEEKTFLLRTIIPIHRTERADVINHAKTLFTNLMSWDDKALLLQVISSIPRPERADAITHAKTLFTGAMLCIEKTLLIQNISLFPQSERAEIINLAHSFLSNEDATNRISFVQALASIPHSERMDVINHARPLLMTRGNGLTKGAAIMFVSAIPQSQRKEVVAAVEFVPDQQRHTLYNVVSRATIIQHIPKERLVGFMKKIIANVPQLAAFTINWADEERMLLLYLLPNDLPSETVLSEDVEDSLENAEYQRAVITAFENELSSNSNGVNMLLALAQFVYDNSEDLLLHDEHPAMQHALEILTAKNVAGEKNPFTLYEKLKRLAKEPSSFQPPSHPVAGKDTAICIKTLQKNARAFHITREELPRDATEEAWKLLINAFKDKIEATSEAQKQLEEIYDTSLDALWDGCLSDSYFVSLLRSSGPSVSIIEAQFRAILHNILAKETHIKEGGIFSEQEELLIKTALSIRNCTAGKKEGIAQMYHLLEESFRYPAKGFETGDKKKDAASAFIAEQIQKIIGNQFSGTNALMQELTGMIEVAEASHHAIYLKNSIGPVVGLYHDVVFDRHTQMLSDYLVAKSREEQLEIFFRHLTPQTLISALVKMTNAGHNAHVFKGHLRAFIEHAAELEEWNLHDDGTMQVTDLAMWNILRKLGYLVP